MEGLTEGRVGHYVPAETDGLGGELQQHLTCLVVRVSDAETGRANLVVFADSVLMSTQWGETVRILDDVEHSTRNEPGTWHWPERV